MAFTCGYMIEEYQEVSMNPSGPESIDRHLHAGLTTVFDVFSHMLLLSLSHIATTPHVQVGPRYLIFHPPSNTKCLSASLLSSPRSLYTTAVNSRRSDNRNHVQLTSTPHSAPQNARSSVYSPTSATQDFMCHASRRRKR
jgi:hypothetical protein